MQSKTSFIGQEESIKTLKRHGIKTAKTFLATSLKDLESIEKKLGYPVVMKVSSNDIIHKTEARAVKTNVHNLEDAKQAFKDVLKNAHDYDREARIDGVIIQEQLPGFELIVGGKIDDQFGPVIVVGAGGVFAEVLKDTSTRVVPITDKDALDMIQELKAFEVLKGVRGEKPANLHAIIKVLRAVSNIMLKENVVELDINPLMVSNKGAVSVDARVIKKA